MAEKHWSDSIVDDIVGAFRVFFVSVILIWVALAVVVALYPPFPLTNESSGIVAVILALFLTFLNYTRGKNKY